MSTNTAIKRKLRWYQWLLVGAQQVGLVVEHPVGKSTRFAVAGFRKPILGVDELYPVQLLQLSMVTIGINE